MRILAIDAVHGGLSLGLFDGPDFEPLAEKRIEAKAGAADAIVPEIDALMRGAGCAFSQLNRIAVTSGPGSYTGLRAGIAAAQGIGLGCGKPVIGVSALTAFAAPFLRQEGEENRILIAAIDARHGAVFTQGFDARGRTVSDAGYALIADAARGFLDHSVIAAGSGAAQLVGEIWAQGGRARLGSAAAEPELAWIARLAAAAPEDAGVKPLYLKKPDARPQDGKAVSRK